MTKQEVVEGVSKLRMEEGDLLVLRLPKERARQVVEDGSLFEIITCLRNRGLCRDAVVLSPGDEIGKFSEDDMAAAGWIRVRTDAAPTIEALVDRLSTEWGYLPKGERRGLAAELQGILGQQTVSLADYEATCERRDRLERTLAEALKANEDACEVRNQAMRERDEWRRRAEAWHHAARQNADEMRFWMEKARDAGAALDPVVPKPVAVPAEPTFPVKCTTHLLDEHGRCLGCGVTPLDGAHASRSDGLVPGGGTDKQHRMNEHARCVDCGEAAMDVASARAPEFCAGPLGQTYMPYMHLPPITIP